MKPSALLACILVAAASLLAADRTAAQQRVDIRFQPGASGAQINGTIVGREYVDYVVTARGGQRMVVSLEVTGTNGRGSAYFNILPAGRDFPALFVGSSEGRRAEVALPTDGDWAIRVYLMGDDRDSGRTVGYSINVYIAPTGGSGGSGDGGRPAQSAPPADDGLSGSPEQFAAMERPCVEQASRLTGVAQRAISVLDRIRTGGGPILTLDAAGTKYTCRLEDDGGVTVFSEFAN